MADLTRAATAALERVEAALPEKLRNRLNATRLYAPGFHVRADVMARLGELRAATDEHFKVFIRYRDADESETERTVRPLGLFFMGSTWSLVGWCDLRVDFRQFRLDRIVEMQVTETAFEDEAGRRLEDYIEAVEREHGHSMNDRIELPSGSGPG